MKRGRPAAAAAMAVGLMTLGASTAYAWTWGTSSNPILMTGGGGYGNLLYKSYSSGVLESWLKDTRLDGERVHVYVYGDYKSADLAVESGRRTDGGGSYAEMADKTVYSGYPYGVQQYFYSVRLCRDKAGFDPCSDAVRTHRGL